MKILLDIFYVYRWLGYPRIAHNTIPSISKFWEVNIVVHIKKSFH